MSITRVSNELGAGNPQGARVAVFAVMLLAVAETTVVSATLFACRRIFGYTFSNEKEVVDYVTAMAPLVCLSVIMDSIQGVLSVCLKLIYLLNKLSIVEPSL
ncbi:hypothetical protein CsSME_00037425 [Camellia sinensis var. sinensis]